MNFKKTIATALLGCTVLGTGMPAFAADTAIIETKDSSAITSTVSSVQPRAASYEVTGDYVRIRTAPSLSASSLGYLMKGDLVAVGRSESQNPVYADGYYWLPVQVTTGNMAGTSGWVASNYLFEIG